LGHKGIKPHKQCKEIYVTLIITQVTQTCATGAKCNKWMKNWHDLQVCAYTKRKPRKEHHINNLKIIARTSYLQTISEENLLGVIDRLRAFGPISDIKYFSWTDAIPQPVTDSPTLLLLL
jgi:hypothetical protein